MPLTAYEIVCAELQALQAARRRGLEILDDLRDWLRGDPRMAREGHSAVVKDGRLEQSYLGQPVLTCSVGDNAIVLEYLCLKDFQNKSDEYKLSEVVELKARMVQLIARAVDRPVPQTQPASNGLINGAYTD